MVSDILMTLFLLLMFKLLIDWFKKPEKFPPGPPTVPILGKKDEKICIFLCHCLAVCQIENLSYFEVILERAWMLSKDVVLAVL